MHWFHILIIIAIAVMTEGSNNTEEYTTVDCLNAVIDTIKIEREFNECIKNYPDEQSKITQARKCHTEFHFARLFSRASVNIQCKLEDKDKLDY